ncbi:MAG: S1/P1 nuclease, partial [Gammaproteobacteria bacterium]
MSAGRPQGDSQATAPALVPAFHRGRPGLPGNRGRRRLPARLLRRLAGPVLATLPFLWSAYAVAWGPAAHRAVAAAAEARLCPPARRAIAGLLGQETLAEASTWPDRIRETPRWRHTRDWHYADVEDDEPISAAWRGDRGRLLIAIQAQLGTLRDPAATTSERAVALRFLAHLLPDLHQPLHVGRPGDAGGNRVTVRLGDRQMTLHKLWDSGLVGLSGLAWQDLAGVLEALISTAELATEGELSDWAEESRALRPFVYSFDERRRVPVISRAYQVTGQHIAMLRLAQSARRLETALEDIWCPDTVSQVIPQVSAVIYGYIGFLEDARRRERRSGVSGAG